MPTAWKRLSVLVLVGTAMLAASVSPAQPANQSVKKALHTIDKRIFYRQKLAWTSFTRVRYWKHTRQGRKALALWVDSCGQLHDPSAIRLCGMARTSLTRHSRRLVGLAEALMVLKGQRNALLHPIRHLAQWRCIHPKEGDWRDGGPPYWGGLQMDLQFMRSYGSDMLRKYGLPYGHSGKGGWANAWTPREQMMVAERAVISRGFHPWPKTAKACGLI
jgi:hypothetical protein